MNGGGTLIFNPVVPLPLVAFAALGLLALTAWMYWRTGQALGWPRRLGLLLFRSAGLALVFWWLLQPSRRDLLPPPAAERVTLIGLDTSLSMNQRDAEEKRRLDAAKNLLESAGVLGPDGTPADPRLRLFEFSDDARPLQKSVFNLVPAGKTTAFNTSVNTMLTAPAGTETANALILLTDGHDLEMINPVKTGAAAHARRAPIYAVALGKQGKVRDVAVRITGYQPYCYLKQKARISATLRLVGCELEDLTVELLRQGQVVQTKRANAQQLQELPVEFEVSEPETGQYEYEVRVQPLEDEADVANNSAITYLNVIDQQIRVLLLEGDPYWDTTFLQRSLMRNDKFDVDVLTHYGPDKVRAIRKTPGTGKLSPPKTLDELAAYDVVVLGRAVDSLFDPAMAGDAGSVTNLFEEYVRERGGTVVFARGRAFAQPLPGELEPVLWGDAAQKSVHLEATAEGRGLSPFRILNDAEGGMDALPDLVDTRGATETRPLAATLARTASRDQSPSEPAMVYRRYGQGQVVSFGVSGLWRWALNAKANAANSAMDRFWDQMILWLLAGRDFVPSRQFSFRPSSANILLGENVYFRLVLRQPDPKVRTVPVAIYYGASLVGRVNLAPGAASATRLTAEFLPEHVGRYRSVASLPDGTTQESRFVVFTENLEETEVATDTLYLRRLCESSGGRLLAAAELPKLLRELHEEPAAAAPKVVLTPIWNAGWIYYLAGVCFGLDWFLRRRWGLC